MATISSQRTRKAVALRGRAREIDKLPGAFQFQPIYGDEARAFASKEILDRLKKENADDARLLVRGTGEYRRDKLERLEVEDVTLLDLLDVPARLDEFRAMRDGWADGIQHPDDWGNGYGKAPRHEGLDWLAGEYPDDLPLPYTYPTPEGSVQMEWTIGAFETELEINLDDHTGEWLWVEVGSENEGDKVLNLDDSDSWAWLASEIRRLRKTSVARRLTRTATERGWLFRPQ